MIRSRLSILLAEKGVREGRKITYRVLSEETGLSQGVFVRLNDNLTEQDRVQIGSLDILCRYLDCTVCDLLEYTPEEWPKTTAE